MGEPFYCEWPAFASAFEELETVASPPDRQPDLASLCFDTDADQLQQTEYTQPAVFAVSTAALLALRDDDTGEFDVVAGHSLGHITACVAAGILTHEQGLSFVLERAAAMAAAGRRAPGRMVAVLFADPAVVSDVCGALDRVSVAAYNTDRQTVVSGHETAVGEAVSQLQRRTDRMRVSDLEVGAAFHSPLMGPAADRISEALDRTEMQPATVPIVSDVTGEPYLNPRIATADLIDQVQSAINWRRVVETLRGRGVQRYIELPPAGTLSDFVERLHPEATVITLESPSDVKNIPSDD